MNKLIGQRIDNYQIISILGRGGMGIVYKAYDISLDRHVAIKILNSHSPVKDRFIERFKREAKNQAKLAHPNIVTVYGFIEYKDFLGIVMEYVEGESLEKVIKRQKRLNLFDALYIGTQILNAIGYAHSKGFIHRDIKPSNIIFNKEGVAKIMDFGISKSLFDKDMTKTGSKVGTVFYMSPEQVRGRDVTHLSDIYSIGCTLYEMIVGQPPFYSDNDYDIMDGHLKQEPPKMSSRIPGTPDLIDEIIRKSLRKDPNERYRDCDEFNNELQKLNKYLEEIPTFRPEGKKPDKKKVKIYSIAGFATFVIVLLVLTWLVYGQVRELLTSDKLNDFKTYSIQSLFSDSGPNLSFEKISTITLPTQFNLNSITFTSDGKGIIVGDSGTCFLSNDNGETWRKNEKIIHYTFYDYQPLEKGNGFLVGSNSQFYFCENGLQKLNSMNLGGHYSLFKLHFINELIGFVVGSKGLILKTTDGGTTWKKMMNNTDNLLFDVEFINDNRGMIIGWNGIAMITNDQGNNWQIMPQFTRRYLKSIDFRDNYGIIVGGNGTIFQSSDSGANWEKIEIPVNIALHKVKFLSGNYAVILGSRGTILVTEDKGRDWNVVKTKSFSQLNDFDISSDGKLFICGSNGTLLRID